MRVDANDIVAFCAALGAVGASWKAIGVFSRNRARETRRKVKVHNAVFGTPEDTDTNTPAVPGVVQNHAALERRFDEHTTHPPGAGSG